MNLIPNGVTRGIGRAILQTKKNSPHIFFVGGVVGVVSSTILACRATLKLESTLDEINGDIAGVNLANTTEERSDQEQAKERGLVYIRSAVKIGKLYGPPVLLGAASMGALAGSHVQLTRRNTALTATLAASMRAYDEYRARMQEELGEEEEFKIFNGIEEKKEGTKKVHVVNPTGYSIYAKIFDETCQNYHKDNERNRVFLQCQQNYANHLLRSRGHVLLNDVYDMIGFERTPAGAVTGWLDNGEGDGFVDFGLFDGVAAARFINGLERSIILDFNVDGIIYDMI